MAYASRPSRQGILAMTSPYKGLIKKINTGTKEAVKSINKPYRPTFTERIKNESLDIIPQLSGPYATKRNKFSQGVPQLSRSNETRNPLDHIFEKFKSGHLCFTGGAGYGKTTLLKGISLNTIRRKYKALSDIEAVMFIKCDQIEMSEVGDPRRLLLSLFNTDFDDNEVKLFSAFVRTFPHKILFVVDGIDNFSPSYLSDMPDAERVKDVIFSLLDGKLIPGCRVISSARSYTDLQQMQKTIDSVVALCGFSYEDTEKIIQRYFKGVSEACKVMSFFQTDSSTLELCRTPMFLVFILMAWEEDPSFRPTLKSEVILFLFRSMIHSEHSKFRKESLVKLGKMCYDMLKDNKIHFLRENLRKYELTDKEITDFVESALVEGSRKLVFSHQSICDMLASFYMMIKMGTDEFKADVRQYMELPHFETVEYVLSGLSLNSKIVAKWQNFLTVKNHEEKKNVMKDYFANRLNMLKRRNDPSLTKRSILSLYEAGDSVKDLIRSQMKSIIFDAEQMVFLVPSDLRAIGVVAGISERLDNLTIHTFWWSINGDVKMLCESILEVKPKISKLDLAFGHLDQEALILIGQLSRSCAVEDLSISSIILFEIDPAVVLKNLQRGLDKYRVHNLDVSYRKNSLEEEEMDPHLEARECKLVYTLDKEQSKNLHTQPVFATKIEEIRPVPGNWKTASYDFIHTVTSTFSNVKENVYLYCWKVCKDERDLIQKELDDLKNLNLRVHLSGEVELAANPKKNMKPVKVSIKNPKKANMQHPKSSSVEPQQASDKFSIAEESAKMNPILQSSTRKEDIFYHINVAEQETYHEEPIRSSEQKAISFQQPNRGFYRLAVTSRCLSPKEFDITLKQIDTRKSLNELEFRDCLTTEISTGVKCLLERLKNLRVKIENISITATEDVDKLAFELHGAIKSCSVTGLNLEESNEVEKCLKFLLQQIRKSELPTLRKLNISYVKNVRDYKLVGELLSGRIEELKMMNCDIETLQLEQLCSGLSDSKVNVLDLSFNVNLVRQNIEMLGKILNDEIQLLALRGCDLSEDELQGFHDPDFVGKQVFKLDLSYNEGFEPEDTTAVGETARKLQVRELALSFCDMDGNHVKSLADILESYKQLTHLDLTGNTKIGSNFPTILRILEGSSTAHLLIGDCKYSAADLSKLAEILNSRKKNIQLSILDVSDSSRKMNDDYCDAICKLLPLVKDELVVCCPNVVDFKEKIQIALNASVNETIKVVYSRSYQVEDHNFFTISEESATNFLQKQQTH